MSNNFFESPALKRSCAAITVNMQLTTLRNSVSGQLLLAMTQGAFVSVSTVAPVAMACALGGVVTLPLMLYMINRYNLEQDKDDNECYHYPSLLERELFTLCFNGAAACVGAIACGLALSQVVWPLLVGTLVFELLELMCLTVNYIFNDKTLESIDVTYESNAYEEDVKFAREYLGASLSA